MWAPQAEKDLKPLDKPTQKRIRGAVLRLAETGHGDVRRVQECPAELALRVGDWRIFFTNTTEESGQPPRRIDVLRVLRVRSRGHAYGR
jgi:mRNA-degrading endonuclease RelE of RelBE toxin-antitoxin system